MFGINSLRTVPGLYGSESSFTHHSFSSSKYFHLLLAPIQGLKELKDNEIDRKIDVTAILFQLVQNRKQTHD